MPKRKNIPGRGRARKSDPMMTMMQMMMTQMRGGRGQRGRGRGIDPNRGARGSGIQ